ncbi:MAG: glycoside hydrolase family 43 C-terminal domain-containing protein [Saprospiraceae bacterium]
MLKYVCILFVISCSNCKSKDTLNTQLIIGKWAMLKVYEYETDQSLKHNPNQNRWIQFNKDGTFLSDGDPFGKNTGRWKLDNKDSQLLIDSEVDDDDSEWKINFKKDTLIWTGIGHPRKENTRIEYLRF